jgi:predicted TIM-barrel fold metal-dependent hydrolase
MDYQRTWSGITIDSHVHMGPIDQEDALLRILDVTGIDRMGLVSIQNARQGTGLPQSLYMKARHPGRFYVFAGLSHAERLSGGEVKTPPLSEQARELARIGCDGIKMIEGKPTARQIMDVPVTDPYFADYWATAQELGLPIVWHVGDPEEFWDPERIPAWARDRNWGYGPDDVPLERLYSEVDEVLGRHPGLRIVFAHFYFLSADLPRAAEFLAAHPSVCLDLAPGVEMLYNMSRDPEAASEFFIDHADRIVFGTDLSSDMEPAPALARAGIVHRWLETGDEFRVPPEADFLLGPPEDGIIHGMGLPEDTLARIYRDNFIKLAGRDPAPLDVDGATALCDRIAAAAEALSSSPAAETEAGRVAAELRRG